MQELRLRSFGMRDVRIVNELRLLNIIRRYQPISRVQISRMTGLNASTVTTIVKRLLAHEMISEGTTGPLPNPPSLLGAVAVALSSILEREVADSEVLSHAAMG